MTQICWDIINVLSDQDNILPDSVRNTQLVEHIGISIREICNHDTSTANTTPDILHKHRAVEIICSMSHETLRLANWAN